MHDVEEEIPILDLAVDSPKKNKKKGEKKGKNKRGEPASEEKRKAKKKAKKKVEKDDLKRASWSLWLTWRNRKQPSELGLQVLHRARLQPW